VTRAPVCVGVHSLQTDGVGYNEAQCTWSIYFGNFITHTSKFELCITDKR